MIKDKLNELSLLDKRFSIFGSGYHKYQLNNVLPEEEIISLEKKHGIKLPSDYRNFLITQGNGGAGKSYGMYKLSIKDSYNVNTGFLGVNYLLRKYISQWWNSDRMLLLENYEVELRKSFKKSLDEISSINLFKKAKELKLDLKKINFYFTEENLLSNPLENIENIYIEIDQSEFKGFIPIFEEGCGHRYVLIVNGQNYGEIVFFGNDGQLAKTSKNFIDFYNDWLDQSIEELTRIMKSLKKEPVEIIIKREWDNKNYSVHSIIYSLLDIEPPKYMVHTEEYIIYLQNVIDNWKENKPFTKPPLDEPLIYELNMKQKNKKWWQFWKK